MPRAIGRSWPCVVRSDKLARLPGSPCESVSNSGLDNSRQEQEVVIQLISELSYGYGTAPYARKRLNLPSQEPYFARVPAITFLHVPANI